jgi:DNA-binding response OmpR family regulator
VKTIFAFNSEALLMSKDTAVLRIMTRVLGEAAFNTTICTESARLAELGMDSSFSLFVLDCPEMLSAFKSMQRLDLEGSKRPRLIVVMNPSDALAPEISERPDVVVTKPIGIRKARESVRRVLASSPRPVPTL